MTPQPRYHIQPLNTDHSIIGFSCEDEELNEYFHDSALTDMEMGLARTFVKIDRTKPSSENISGFFTLRAHALPISEDYFEEAPLTEEETAYVGSIEVPLVELMFLARDIRWKGMGMGDVLMIDALNIVAQAAECIGFIGLHLRSTAQGISLYKRYSFQPFQAHPHFDNARFILPLRLIQSIVAEYRREEP